MSGNLARTQELFRIWNAREFDDLLDHVAEDIEWIPATMTAVEGGSYRGREELSRFFAEWAATWKTWEVRDPEMREIDAQVLVLGHVYAEGAGSGVTLDQPVAYLFEFRDGLLARGQTFFDQGEAEATARERDPGGISA